MEGVDLFAELDKVAADYGWMRLGQPEQFRRRYGRGELTIRVYANRSGTGIVRASIMRLGYTITALAPLHAGKRATIIEWMRWQR